MHKTKISGFGDIENSAEQGSEDPELAQKLVML